MIPDNVMIAIFSEELHRKSSHITNGVRTTLFTASCTQTEQDWGFLADAVEEFR